MVDALDVIANSEDVAWVVLSNGDEMAKANARLIAAAPELLETLRMLENAASDTLRSHPETECCAVTRMACDKARAAIAKATSGNET